MKKISSITIIYLSVLLVCSSNAYSQNLVPNPSFESYLLIPYLTGQHYLVDNWSSVSFTSTPDYFHTASTATFGTTGFISAGLPSNIFGTVNPVTGNAIMGLAIKSANVPEFREYISTSLISPMVIGNTYTVSFYATSGSVNQVGGFATDNLEVCLSAGPLTQTGTFPITSSTPQYSYGTANGSSFYNTSWELISFSIVATQAWNQITIGNFKNDANTISYQVVPATYPYVYIYIDDVSIVPLTPLPIELINFDAKINDNETVDITWQTASEINSDYFTVEKSEDGVKWKEVQKASGAGNSQKEISYVLEDTSPYSGTSYYRLRQTDFNGDYKYSDAVTIEYPFYNTDLTIIPNPVNQGGNLSINFKNPNNKKVKIILRDVIGNEIYSTEISSANNTRSFNLQIDSKTPKGIYFLTVQLGSELNTEKIIVN